MSMANYSVKTIEPILKICIKHVFWVKLYARELFLKKLGLKINRTSTIDNICVEKRYYSSLMVKNMLTC